MGAATHIMAAAIRVAALLLFSACVCNGASMRAAVGLKATPAGDFSQIALHSVPIPECCADTQVLVRAKASSVNPVDWKIMEASAGGSVFPITFPHIPGFDCAGEVIQSGTKSSWKPGDLVWGMSTGAFAEYVVLESSALGHKPESMSMGDAAALGGVAGLTSLQSLQQTGAPWPMKKYRLHCGDHQWCWRDWDPCYPNGKSLRGHQGCYFSEQGKHRTPQIAWSRCRYRLSQIRYLDCFGQ